jgi:hypothetical protein
MEPAKDNAGTRVSFSYVVGGYMRYKVPEIAPAVDKVLGEQFKSMLAPFAAAETEVPKLDSFKLDIETITEVASDETSEATPNDSASASEPPQTEPN